LIPPLPIWPKPSPATKSAVLRNGKAHADEFKNFRRVFGQTLDDFWGRPGRDFDGVVRQQPSNAQGFDLETFIKAFGLKLAYATPDKAFRTRFLGLVAAKWGEQGVLSLTRLLGAPGRLKSNMRKKAGTDSE
jgi:hypothetical protein